MSANGGWANPPENEREAFRRILTLYDSCFENNDIGMREALESIRTIADGEYQRLCRPPNEMRK